MLDAVPREMLERVGEERPVDDRQHVLARAIGERSEPRALATDQDHRGETHMTGRPMPSYVKPSARISSGSSRFRPSTITVLRIRSAAAAQSSSRSSGHSVTTTAASAPSSASSAVFAISTPCRCASPFATGSHAVTSAPSERSRPARTRLGASRMSSVPGLNASPRSAIRFPRSGPSRRSSFPMTRRFCSSFTSMTAFRSWKL